MIRPSLRRGFTIVELLIVIVVIGILVTIVVVSYNGIQGQAIDKGVLSDADAVEGEVVRYGTKNNGQYGSAVEWYSGGSANANIKFTPSEGNVIDVVASDGDYCIRVFNAKAQEHASLSAAVTKESSYGICDQLEPSTIAQAEHPGGGVNQGVVTTFAGTGTAGFADGSASTAQFYYPNDITMDSQGNLYVADSYNRRIRKITPTGIVSTLAGSGVNGYLDATGTAAQFNYPGFVGVDASDNIYVSDSNRIRKITQAGVVTTIAGGGTAGYVDATGTDARFSSPEGLDVDSVGNIYVADNSNQRVRKITPAGVVTTLAGSTSGYVDGVGSEAKFVSPSDILIDDTTGDIFVADNDNSVIRKVTTAGLVTTHAGSVYGYLDGALLSARFMETRSIAFDASGRMYIVDRYDKRMRMISDGQVTTVAGSGAAGYVDATGTAASLRPEGVIASPSGTLYIADRGNHVIRKIK